MDSVSLAKKVTGKCPPLAYPLIPVSKAVDRARKFGLHERVEENIRIFCTEQQRSDKRYMRRLRRDIWRCVILYSCAPVEYFLYGFGSLNHTARQAFVCSWEGKAARKKITAANPERAVFAGKYNTYLKFKDHYKRDVILVDADTPEEVFNAFTSAHPRFIVKPYFSEGGKGVHFEDVTMTPPPRGTFKAA